MADNSYIFFNSNINVNIVKVSTQIQDFTTAEANMTNITPYGMLFTSYTKKIVDAIYVPVLSVASGEKIAIYRKTPTQNYFEYLGILEAGEFNFSDYYIVSDQWYHYLASITVDTSDPLVKEYQIYESKDIYGKPIYTYTNWQVFTICSIDETDEDGVYAPVSDTWVFSGNIDAGSLVQNRSVTTWNTLGKLPKVSVGKQSYMSGSISCLLGSMKTINDERRYTEKSDVDYAYARGNDLLEAWQVFCSDNYLKLLRDVKGNSWIVQITDSPTDAVNVDTVEQITTIAFNWIEVEQEGVTSILKILEDS